MKITKKQLMQIIKEELEVVMAESAAIEQKLADVLKMQIWSAMGGAYADKDEAEAQAKAQVEELKKAGSDLEQEFARVDAENRETYKAAIGKVKPFKRQRSYGMEPSDASGYSHPSRNEE